MVKSYLRYEPGLAFGVIVSVDANICYDPSGKHLLAPALDNIGLWNLKQGLCSKTFSPSTRSSHSLALTSIASSPSSSVNTKSPLKPQTILSFSQSLTLLLCGR